jgi:transketolase
MTSEELRHGDESFAAMANRIRRSILAGALKAGSNGAHIAPSLSCVEILIAAHEMAKDNGRVILSKGHAGLALYSTMLEMGIMGQEAFDTFETDGGNLPGQPSKNADVGIAYSSGSLGMLLSYACGRALVSDKRFFVIVGNGEANEGSVWESAMFAGSRGLGNLAVVVDDNRMQADGNSEDVLRCNAAGLFGAAGWDVVERDGHSVPALLEALGRQGTSRPLAVIARTVKGKGVSFMENAKEWHHARLSQAQYEKAMQEIGGACGN